MGLPDDKSKEKLQEVVKIQPETALILGGVLVLALLVMSVNITANVAGIPVTAPLAAWLGVPGTALIALIAKMK